MRGLIEAAGRIGAARAAALGDALAQAAADELPAGLRADHGADGLRIAGPDLVRRIAFDGLMARLVAALERGR